MRYVPLSATPTERLFISYSTKKIIAPPLIIGEITMLDICVKLDGKSISIVEAITDWHEITYPIGTFISINGGVVYAVPKLEQEE